MVWIDPNWSYLRYGRCHLLACIFRWGFLFLSEARSIPELPHWSLAAETNKVQYFAARWCELTLTPTLDMVVSGKILFRIFALLFCALAVSCRDKVQYFAARWYELTLIDPSLNMVVSGKILSRIFALFFFALVASCRDKVQYFAARWCEWP